MGKKGLSSNTNKLYTKKNLELVPVFRMCILDELFVKRPLRGSKSFHVVCNLGKGVRSLGRV